MTRAEHIAAAIAEVRARIRQAETLAGRAAGCVRLIAVSKKMPADDVRAALGAGQQDFGENYAQELRDKRSALDLDSATGLQDQQPPTSPLNLPRPRWHYLGPIQRNKVKILAGQVTLIQSVDDADILTEIDRRATGLAPAVSQACLIQVNVADEIRKGGVPPHRLSALLDRFATVMHVSCVGLMLIPPHSEDAAVTRRHFATLRELAEREAQVSRPHVALTELSMGMSSDFADAVAEGATMVRVGTAIFGQRTAR